MSLTDAQRERLDRIGRGLILGRQRADYPIPDHLLLALEQGAAKLDRMRPAFEQAEASLLDLQARLAEADALFARRIEPEPIATPINVLIVIRGPAL